MWGNLFIGRKTYLLRPFVVDAKDAGFHPLRRRKRKGEDVRDPGRWAA
jgi:hypothetical protein